VLYCIEERQPTVGKDVYIAAGAIIIGSTVLRDGANIWFNSVLRGDNDLIDIGAGSNIQDACVLHTDPGFELVIGQSVSIGHQSMLHGCRIGDGSLVGIQSVILNGAEIGEHCLIGAKALITENKKIPPYSVVMGAPGKVVREITEGELTTLKRSAEGYVRRAQSYIANLKALAVK
jgi:carbonic anhydrase/acetyltransferase-like protein (isoleucine patch superfamily)